MGATLSVRRPPHEWAARSSTPRYASVSTIRAEYHLPRQRRAMCIPMSARATDSVSSRRRGSGRRFAIMRALYTREGRHSMNILVTGGAGFIGSQMAKRHLADGHRAVIVDNLSSGKRERLPGAARFVFADIADTDLTALLSEEKIEFVSHHGAHIDLRQSVADPMGDARSNIVGSLRLLEACRAAGVRRFLFASTGGALYGEPEGGRPAPESHPTDPISPYGCAKLSVEKYLHYYRVIHDFQVQVLRYANVYGPGQN